jgi:DNA mismatch endonuclease (patch repair protein)
MGYRFRLHRKDVPGKPDIVLPKHHKVIFVHGCFWHGHEGCSRAARPTSNQEFWDKKLSGNKERDRRNLKELEKQGWRSLIVWQCELKDPAALTEKISAFMKR